MAHTGKWPKDLSVEDKRVGIIGSGSTGIQVRPLEIDVDEEVADKRS